uniref:Uncharacterized protein n=1 Tax=Nelumbo nucifera TaxID=4432 RepID=A0A822Y855_NELNU|nr:TPA_asm: hypothetical protein HUJ06_029691 [Nelumbo nucifera]
MKQQQVFVNLPQFLVIKMEELLTARPDSDSDGDHKRKQLDVETETQYPDKSQRNASSLGDNKGSYKQQKREKLDWSVLRPPKAQTKRD